MNIFAISDLHLTFANPEKSMQVFENWENYVEQIQTNWKKAVSKDDLVLIAGDTSWAIKLKDAMTDLEWINNLPGKKVIIKGNHDYWWPSVSKLRKVLPPSIQCLQNNALNIEDVSIAGTRLWDSPEYNFDDYINFTPNPKSAPLEENIQKDLSQKIFARETERLKLSLDQMNKTSKIKIVMTHFPPIGADLKSSIVSNLLEEHKINICIFGHLHNLKKDKKLFGEKNNIKYILTSADWLDFKPVKIT